MSVYVEPLIDDLLSAWDDGVWTYDRATKRNFRMYVWYLLTLLNAPDLYTASAQFRVAFPSEYFPKVYQSTEPKKQETIY